MASEVRMVADNLARAMGALDCDWGDSNFTDTPERWAKWLIEFAGPQKGETIDKILSPLFPEAHQEMIVVRDIDFTAMCAHHFLPFMGKACIGYIPNEEGAVVGLSKLVRAVQFYARRFTLQERITSSLADNIDRVLQPRGVMVVIEATHLCMRVRGVKDPTSFTVTSAVRGVFAENSAGCKDEFLTLIGRKP